MKDAITVNANDAARVHNGNMFNDVLIDFRLHTLFYGDSSIHPDHNPLTSDQVHIFSSLFLTN